MKTPSEKNKTGKNRPLGKRAGEPAHRVRIPGFITEEIPLGDAVKRFTSAVGIRSCAGCRRRAATLNRWLVFTPSRRHQAR